MYLIAYKPRTLGPSGDGYTIYSSDDEYEVKEFLNAMSYEELHTAVVMQGEFLGLKRDTVLILKPRGNDETAS